MFFGFSKFFPWVWKLNIKKCSHLGNGKIGKNSHKCLKRHDLGTKKPEPR